jgi:hypothetical protein
MNTMITNKATEIRNTLKAQQDFTENPIDSLIEVVPPFIGKGELKLIIIGLEPTLEKTSKKEKITTCFSLDNSGAIKNYIKNRICNELSIELNNLYATSLFKYFYTKSLLNDKKVTENHLEPNLKLLIEEINEYPNLPILILGQPLLKLLSLDEKDELKKYMGSQNVAGDSPYKACKNNKLNRVIFPFPHLNTLRKKQGYYYSHYKLYLEFMKTSL